MPEDSQISNIHSELQEGMSLAKCRKCGCMKETLEDLESTLSSNLADTNSDLLKNTQNWLDQMEPIQYPCIGCAHCFPAVATNLIHQAFPESAQNDSSGCSFEIREDARFPVPGEYFAFCHGGDCPVAVSTLASVGLAEQLANLKPRELCIVGKTETENIGIDKVVKNIVSNPTIRFLLLTGKDSEGHYSGKTLLALAANGVDDRMKVIGSPGKRPILKNVTHEEVEVFRKQVQIVDLIDCEDVDRIVGKMKELSQEEFSSCGCAKQSKKAEVLQLSDVSTIQAEQPTRFRMDKTGYFVILPKLEKRIILAEHYSYDNTLLRVIEGNSARSLYWTIIENGWVTQLDHAAYLGEELARAELSIQLGFRYVQDKAVFHEER
ncbi:DUF4346 domain-containing protein [Thermosynechococcaceae cyanobacterium BACA0444]|uniref:DUF4346 domain-containing protein n=1 Tax=Pseudocalidococcus azoricus BACA0444 TaxID=2918990 RepID=A0AAE4JZZ3_9CYAN|nr:DUF4346 domain-containing protein [Pseudocalidococcus azoricus]MDS3861387.1 DUF4346 domain-containing protein [Pseudocalidococcus azoricus BACA0444]